MARYFRLPFGVSGTRVTLPDTTPDSAVSYDTGYTDEYEQDPATNPDARLIERNIFNQLMFDVTSTLQLYYQTGTPPFIASADNDGNAFTYPQYARVLFNDRVYESITDNNATMPTDTSNWRLVDSGGLDAIYSLRANNLSDLANVATARTNLELGTAAQVDTGTGSTNVPTTAQADARYLLESNNLSDLDNAATARSNLGNVQTQTQADNRYLLETNNLSDLDDVPEARENLELGTAGLYNAFTGSRDLAVVPVGLISQWHNDTIPPDDWVIARGQSTSIMSQQIRDIFGNTLPDLQAESTNTEAIIHTGPLISDFYMPLRDNLDIVSGTGPATFTRSTTATYVDRFGQLRSAAINEPRFEREGILIEGASTNNVNVSEQTWSVETGVTVTEGNGFGEFNSYIISHDGTATLGRALKTVLQTGSVGDVGTASLWARNTGSVSTRLVFFFGTETGNESSIVIPANTTEWTRFSVSNTIIDTSSTYSIQIRSSNAYTVEIAAPQVEALPFASSYIPTEGSAVTREPDVLSVPTSGNLSESIEDVTVMLRYNLSSFEAVINARRFYGTSSSTNHFSAHAGISNTGLFSAYTYTTGSAAVLSGQSATLSGVLIARQDNNTQRLNIGSLSATNSVLNPPESIGNTLVIGGIGTLPTNTTYIYGNIKDFRIWNRSLADNELP